MELVLPELMTQNDRTAIVSFVVQNKGSAEHRSHAQHTKEICGHILHFDHRRRFVSSRSEFPRCSVGVGRNRLQRVALEAIASYAYGTSRKFTPAGNEPPTMVEVEYVSADFFRVLGVTPMLGRSFVLDDERDDSRPIILSHQFWESEFHSSPDIVGK